MPQEPVSPKPSLGGGSQKASETTPPLSPASPIFEKDQTPEVLAVIKARIEELDFLLKAIGGAARGFQSYPVAREAMSRLTISILKRKTELEQKVKP